jgi:(5-formylfuran-3-yl)methyl phosphate transaminase
MGCREEAPARRTCMGFVDEALRLEREGKRVIHLEKGEMDMDTPEVVKERAIEAIRDNRTRYSDSNGLPELRQAICDHHRSAYGVTVEPSQVFVNSGSSPAMLELFLSVLEPGDEVVLPDPGYPAYPSFVEAARGRVLWARTAGNGFVHSADVVRPLLTPRTRAVLINFPSNPVGALADERALRAFAELGPLVVSDEVYHGLTFDGSRAHTILEVTDEAVAVGSFSKAFAMTGWRLGYLVVPKRMVESMLRLQQNLFVGASTFVQYAAVAALEHAEDINRQLREELHRRRDCMLETLDELGFDVPHPPRGGFYVLARLPSDAWTSASFADDLLARAHVATTPGTEFGPDGEGYVRFSLSSPCSLIIEAKDRIAAFLEGTAAPAVAAAAGSVRPV